MVDDDFYILNSRVLKLRDWIDVDKLSSSGLSRNIAAIKYLENHPNMIEWFGLSGNSEAIDLLLANPDKIDMEMLCSINSDKVIEFLIKYLDNLIKKEYKRRVKEIDWDWISSNTSNKTYDLVYPKRLNKIDWEELSGNSADWAGEILRKNIGKIDWEELSDNSADWAIKILSENIDLINWEELSGNSCKGAIELLKKYPHKINYEQLSINCCKEAVDMLRENISEIDWTLLSRNSCKEAVDLLLEYPDRIVVENFISNSNAYTSSIGKDIIDKYLSKIDLDDCVWNDIAASECIDLIEKYRTNINYGLLSENPAIFEIDYDFIDERFSIIREELYKAMLHPKRFTKYLLMGYNMSDDSWNDDLCNDE